MPSENGTNLIPENLAQNSSNGIHLLYLLRDMRVDTEQTEEHRFTL